MSKVDYQSFLSFFYCLFYLDQAVAVSLRLCWMAFPVWEAKLMVCSQSS